MKTSRLRALLDVGLELVDLGALAADDDARTRGADDQAQLVAGALDLDRADAGGLQLLAQLSLELDVFDQQLVIAALDKPARLPRLVDAEAKPIRMDFLSHSFPLLRALCRLSRRAVVQNFKFTRNCLLRGLFGCSLLGGGLLGCGLLAAVLVAAFFVVFFAAGAGRCFGGCAYRSGRLLLRNGDDDVCEPALVAEGAAHRGRADPLHARAFVRDGGADVEVVDIDVQTLLLRDVGGVLDRRTQDLLDRPAPCAWC